MRARTSVGAIALATACWVGACSDAPPFTPSAECPNEFPMSGASCVPGLVCSYAEPSNCTQFFTATCTADGAWELDRPCGTGGAAQGGGGEPGDGGGGEMGGQGGGGGGCVDPVEGAPAITSALTATYPPDKGTGSYPLTFGEAVVNVGAGFTWSGPGSFDGVSKIGNEYRVRYSGLAPGDSATLTVDGVEDSCGQVMEAPVDVTIGVLPSCHLLDESFEGDFLQTGWSAIDNGIDGHVWGRSDGFDAPNGVDNHTDGTGMCATTNDIDSLVGSAWNTELISPAIDLTGVSSAVLRYQSAFQDPGASGEGFLEASPDGTQWTTVKTFGDDDASLQIVDLSPWGGAPVYLRWRYANDGGVGAWWDVDDVCVEQFTQATCNCLPGGTTEIKDMDGVSDGNGDVFTAETTLAVLTQLGDRAIACGDLEDVAISGADFFRFEVGASAGPLTARVSYCVENSFQDAVSGIWLKSDPTALAQVDDASGEGSYEVTLDAGFEHFVSLAAAAAPYTASRYRMTVDVIGVATPILSESFEAWPPVSFTISDDDPCADWLPASQTVVPSGSFPTDGNGLAYFNSYDCPMGSEALESELLNFVGLNSVLLTLDMFHDPGFPGASDTIQVEYNTGSGWIPIGAPLVRPGPIAEWTNHAVDLSALGGITSLRVRLNGTSAYGNHTHIDNVVLLSN